MVDYVKSFKATFSEWEKLGLSFLFSLIPIVGLFARGYELECSRNGQKKKLVLPEWNNFGMLFWRALQSCFIALFYILPGLALLVIGLRFVIESAIQLSQTGVNVLNPANELILSNLIQSTPIDYPFFIIGTILTLIGIYLIPMATMNFIAKNKFSGAFDIKKIIKLSLTREMFFSAVVALLIAIIINIIGGILIGLSSSTPIYEVLAYLIDTASSVVIGITVAFIFGQTYNETNKEKENKHHSKTHHK